MPLLTILPNLGMGGGGVVAQDDGAKNWQEQQTAGWTHVADQRPQIQRNVELEQTIQANVSQS